MTWILKALKTGEFSWNYLETSFVYFMKCDQIPNFVFALISSFELKMAEFFLGSVINAIVSQAMFLLRDRGLQLIRDIPEEIKSIVVFGDQIRIQQLLAEFLLSIIRYAPSQEWVEIHLSQVSKQEADGFTAIRTEFRYISLFPLLSPHICNYNCEKYEFDLIDCEFDLGLLKKRGLINFVFVKFNFVLVIIYLDIDRFGFSIRLSRLRNF